MSSHSTEPDENIDWLGEEINEKYILIKKLGAGSFCSVWMAYNCMNDLYYAVKITHRDYYDDGVKEARILNKLKNNKSKNVIKLIETCDFEPEKININNTLEDNDNVFFCLVLELLGENLYKILKNNKLSEDVINNIGEQILTGIKDIHKNNFIHGDIKPENILITKLTPGQEEIINKIKSNDYKDLYKKKCGEVVKKYGIKINPNKLKLKASKRAIKDMFKEDDTDYFTDDDTDYFRYRRGDISSDENSASSSDTRIISNIDKIEIRITDFGGYLDKPKPGEYISDFDTSTTQYYRNPSLLLNIPFNENIDYWAYYCMMYELHTGTLLFDTRQYKEYECEDRVHLYLITKIVGPLDKTFIDKSLIYDVFYKRDGTLKYTPSSNYKSIIYNNAKEILQYK